MKNETEPAPTTPDATGATSPPEAAPPNEMEAAIADIWAKVLDVEHVGPQDNFLLLGGESLLATQVASMILDAFQREVSIRSILVGTVADVAAEVSARDPVVAR